MQPPLPPLSIFLITRDEADRLPATLAAVGGLGREIVVVDSGSTDATVAVAEAAGARVVVNAPFPGYGPQKRLAEDACTQPWLLNIDADEVVTPALADEIRALFTDAGPAADGYEISIVETFPGEAEPGRWAYALAPVRLYRRDRGRYADSTVHDRVAFADGARIERLAGRIHHRSIRSLGEQLAKLDRYSTMQAEDFLARRRRLPTLRLYTEFPLAFLKAWIGRRLILRGTYGYMVAINYAIFRHTRVAKIYDSSMKPR